MKKLIYYAGIVLLVFRFLPLQAQEKSLAEEIAARVVGKLPPASSAGDEVMRLQGLDGLWQRTAQRPYIDYLQHVVVVPAAADGTLTSPSQQNLYAVKLDQGRALLTLYKVTGESRYFQAATSLWNQLLPLAKSASLSVRPFPEEGLRPDSLYMMAPFLAEYALLTHQDQAFDGIADRVIRSAPSRRDAVKASLGHDTIDSGHGPFAMGPAIALGYQVMALVDVLDNFPADHPKRKVLLAMLNRLAKEIQTDQNRQTAAAYNQMDRAAAATAVEEATASSMFVYALQKGVRQDGLAKIYNGVAQRVFDRIRKQMATAKSGSFAGINLTTALPEGLAALLLAANEMESAALPKPGRGKRVLLDCFFNSEHRTDQSGILVPWHYKWDERGNGGYSMWGGIFEQRGFVLDQLPAAPTATNLKQASIYIISDPDVLKENPHPNYINPGYITTITEWVNNGGVLVLMANDTGNVELEHFNQLASQFGLHFNSDSKGKVTDNDFEMGAIAIAAGNPLFKHTSQIFVKEYSSIHVQAPAKAVLLDREGNTVMAVARLGKGTVFAIGDPWLYNEYTDGRKIPATYENFQAAGELTDWIAGQIPQQNRK